MPEKTRSRPSGIAACYPPRGSAPGGVPRLGRVGTLEQAGPAPAVPQPGFLWRVLSPIGAVLLAFVVLVIAAGALSATDLSDDSTGALLSFGTSLLLLAFAIPPLFRPAGRLGSSPRRA